MPSRKRPKRPGRAAASDTPKLDFRMSKRTAQKLAELQKSVYDADHGWPSQRLLVSALIQNEERRGEGLYRDLLVRVRRRDPDFD